MARGFVAKIRHQRQRAWMPLQATPIPARGRRHAGPCRWRITTPMPAARSTCSTRQAGSRPIAIAGRGNAAAHNRPRRPGGAGSGLLRISQSNCVRCVTPTNARVKRPRPVKIAASAYHTPTNAPAAPQNESGALTGGRPLPSGRWGGAGCRAGFPSCSAPAGAAARARRDDTTRGEASEVARVAKRDRRHYLLGSRLLAPGHPRLGDATRLRSAFRARR